MMEYERRKCLTELIRRAYTTPYYRRLWGSARRITLDSFSQLPLAGKELFSAKDIKNSLAVPEQKIANVYFSSGTSGNPKMIPLTERETLLRALSRKKSYELGGITKGDRVAVLTPFGPWVAGLEVQHALLLLECAVFPVGLLDEPDEIRGFFSIIQHHDIDTIITTPSCAELLLEFQKTLAQSSKVRIKRFIALGEFLPVVLRRKLKESFGSQVLSSYGSSESHVGIECDRYNGFHFDPSRLVVEVVDEHTFLPTEDPGLLVLTDLYSESVPLVRYPLGDIGLVDTKRCSCGLELPRVVLRGRSRDIFGVAGGVTVYPYQIRDALSKGPIKVDRCEVHLFNKGRGRDIILFRLYTDAKGNVGRRVVASFEKLVTEMSIDFSDVVYNELVELRVAFAEKSDSGKTAKKKTIEIYDKREYTR